MKLKKVLSLLLAIGSLATTSSFLASKAVSGSEAHIGSSMKKAHSMEKRRNKFTKKLYKMLVGRCAPVKNNKIFGAVKIYLQRMVNNPQNYKDDIAKVFGIRVELVNADYINDFLVIGNYILDQSSDKSVVRPFAIPKRLDFTDNN